MIITIVVAIASNNAIGKNNQLLWHLPNDLKHFKDITTGHTVIMGRKTFDSVGKPLPRRRNIIITRQNLLIDGCEVVHSLDAAMAICKNGEEVMIIGGAEIYREALPLTNRIYLTIVHQDFGGDTFFPEIDYTKWKETAREEHQPDEKHLYAYSFVTLETL
jgi:dihydrofolate reductase